MPVQKTKTIEQKAVKESKEKIDRLLLVLSDLIIDSFLLKRQQTEAIKTRHNKNELKQAFQDSDSPLSQS